MGYFYSSPHIIKVENGKPIGAAYDWFTTYILPNLEGGVNWDKSGTPLPRLLSRLKEGKVDAAILFGKRPDREKFLHYPAAPYLVTKPSLLVKSGFNLKQLASMNDAKSLKIGFLVGGFIPPVIKKENYMFNLIAGSNGQDQNLKKVMAGRIDAMFSPQGISLEFMARERGIENDVRVLNFPVPEVSVYSVFSKSSVDKGFVERYEMALKKAEEKMPYKQFVSKWTPP